MDRVAVVVGRRAVKLSDIERDLRGSQFLNRQKLDVSDAARKNVAERLVDQELIRQELQNGRYSSPTAADVDAFLDRLKRERFASSDAQFLSGLKQYGLTPEQFRDYLRWQLTVLRFIDERFRPGVLVTDEDIKAYYEQNRAELARANPKANTLEALEPRIRDLITGQRVNENFEEWLNQSRRQTRIQYQPVAFGRAPSSEGVKP
jgi:parvulin-like peptidyl-prolyl isomerase